MRLRATCAAARVGRRRAVRAAGRRDRWAIVPSYMRQPWSDCLAPMAVRATLPHCQSLHQPHPTCQPMHLCTRAPPPSTRSCVPGPVQRQGSLPPPAGAACGWHAQGASLLALCLSPLAAPDCLLLEAACGPCGWQPPVPLMRGPMRRSGACPAGLASHSGRAALVAACLQSATTAIGLFKRHFADHAGDVEGLEEVVSSGGCFLLLLLIMKLLNTYKRVYSISGGSPP